MSPSFMSFYVLMWPVAVAAILFVLVRAFGGEWKKARRLGRSLV